MLLRYLDRRFLLILNPPPLIFMEAKPIFGIPDSRALNRVSSYVTPYNSAATGGLSLSDDLRYLSWRTQAYRLAICNLLVVIITAWRFRKLIYENSHDGGCGGLSHQFEDVQLYLKLPYAPIAVAVVVPGIVIPRFVCSHTHPAAFVLRRLSCSVDRS
ncbi:hypothetical protein G7K_6645-t1 [Saitoella complicata NRRL Y-17804]|uniref:Uncharacterized protein n=1 Tax=Saitoella complicata (strain BCRC 22490 / CBS 7301 / JCM 7358 / NBRC 10748 / NRRL Y-17804) TaxID=698492 RepID=A0A0E9NRS2_SAICN|nr:hypothetical protein G7K_6645-t1 [Saitoella complicata NRRL Y-17804]